MANEVVVAKGRPPCPFYGFIGVMGILTDNEGNACGLAGGHRPCAMEKSGESPNWSACTHYNHPRNAEKIGAVMNLVRVFPNELGQDGVTLKEWFDLILATPS